MLAAAILLFGIFTAHAQAPASPNPNELPPIPGVENSPPPQPQGQSQPQEQPQVQSQPQDQPLMTPLPPNLSGKPMDAGRIKQRAEDRVKSPFMLPKEIYLRLMKKRIDAQAEGFVDMSVDAKRRWALKYYKLVAVIWNVKKPKAMIMDRDNKMQLFREKDYIGNQEGFISEINNGEVVVSERGNEIKLKLEK